MGALQVLAGSVGQVCTVGSDWQRRHHTNGRYCALGLVRHHVR